jgi:hypothetical protein
VPRIRSIQPDIWDDDDIAAVSRPARLVFVGLITQADDDGYLPGATKWVRSKVFPYDDIDVDSVDGWLEELHRVGLVVRYLADGKPYIWLPNWEKHQSIDKRWYKQTKFPKPSERPLNDSPKVVESAPDEPDGVVEPERIGEDRSGEEGIGESEIEIPDAPLSDLLASLVAENTGKAPTISKAWIDAERLMLGKDGRGPEEAERLIRWTARDEFWRANVLSMPKFREKYDQLLLTAKRGKTSSAGMDNARRLAERAKELRAAEGAQA